VNSNNQMPTAAFTFDTPQPLTATNDAPYPRAATVPPPSVGVQSMHAPAVRLIAVGGAVLSLSIAAVHIVLLALTFKCYRYLRWINGSIDK
jgi:hypothetical protein